MINNKFVASFYCYLNHNSKTDFVIDLNNVWKWVGFSRIDPAKRVLENHFTKDTDYKTVLHQSVENLKGGRPKEQTLMTINTFKKFCLKANTKKADDIHDYYIKMEELLQEAMNEENQEMKSKLQEQEKRIEKLENKPKTEGFIPNTGYIYLIEDVKTDGSFKVGLGEPDTRVSTLNIASCQKSLKIFAVFPSKSMKRSEKIIHQLLEPFRIVKRAEWFYFSDDTALTYAINTIKDVISNVDKYTFENYAEFKEYADKLPNIIEETKTQYTEQKVKPITNKKRKRKNDKVSDFIGVSWAPNNNKWMCRLTKDRDTIFLGNYVTEIEAAKIYNDYAIYLNKKFDLNYTLNEVEGYIPNPRDVPAENNAIKLENKTSNFNGVYFVKSKQYFEANITYKKKKYPLGNNLNDVECAKIYNEQALYFNNHLGTSYKLNEIQDFETTEKNHVLELDIKKIKKFSRFTGVSVRNDSNKFRAYIKHDGKRIDCGTFKDEIDAAKAYNKKANELNALESTRIKYSINDIDN